MTTLNTNTSIIDLLKSRGQDSSRASRAKLAVEQGIVKDTSQYVSSFSQNVALLGKVKSIVPNAPANVANAGSDATSFINAAQKSDVATATTKDAPPVRSTTTDLVSAFKSITGKSSLTPDTPMPAAPDFSQSFSALRSKFNVDQLESTINSLDAQQQDIQAQLRTNVTAEKGKPVAMNVISGKVSEQVKTARESLDFISRQKQSAVSELQTANDAIQNIMTYKKMDYTAAKDHYNTEFAQNIQLFNTIKGSAQFASTEKNKAEDNARANLQIIYNSIKSSGDMSNIDAVTSVKIQKLEMQAGLPQGFYKTIAADKPKAKVLSTTTRSTGGKKYADVLYRNPNGSLTTQTVTLGADTKSGTTSKSLISSGFSNEQAQYISDGVAKSGLASVYAAEKKAGATPEQLASLASAYGSVTKEMVVSATNLAATSGKFDVGALLRETYTSDQLKELAKNAGFTTMWWVNSGDIKDFLASKAGIDAAKKIYTNQVYEQYKSRGKAL